ncbi:MAG: phage protein GemA/Gp16 family protein, partial [Candidatus Gastranaerophilaceae bacterium]
MITLSSPKQRQKLGYFRKLLNISEETYQDLLAEFGVESSKNLTTQEIEALTAQLRKNAAEQGLYKPKPSFIKYKYNNLIGRQGMASPAQLRKIEVMWKNVS